MYINIDIKWKENEKKKKINYFKIYVIFCKVVMIYGYIEKILILYDCYINIM